MFLFAHKFHIFGKTCNFNYTALLIVLFPTIYSVLSSDSRKQTCDNGDSTRKNATNVINMENQIVNSAEEWFVHYGGSDKNRPLSIKSATVINSKDVHFGDRTYYDGPVIIKQYILVDDDEYLENELEGGCIEGDGGGEDRDEVAEDVTDCVGCKVETDADCDGYKVIADFTTIDATQTKETKLLNDFPGASSYNNTTVSVADSEEVHFGRQIHYKGPVTVERLLYPKSKVDFHALESKLWLNDGTDASARLLTIISRLQWQGRPPMEEPYDLIHPAPYVIINHTATANCTTRLECIRYIRAFQKFHVETRQWYDIGYNFLVGADGNVYDGRGWDKVGAHTRNYNHVSIGVAFVGTFSDFKAPKRQLAAFWRLMKEGVRKGYISRKYRIFAARQLRPTDSPGKALYEQMKNWPRWQRTLEITEL